MGKQLFNRHPLFTEFAELRDVARNRVGEADLPALNQNHHRRRRRQHFCKRGEIEDRINGHRLCFRFESAMAKRFAIDDAPFARHQNDRAGRLFALDGLAHGFINLRQPLAHHADRFGGGLSQHLRH